MLTVLSALAGVPCGFTPPPASNPVLPKGAPGGALTVRDAFGDFGTFETDHFAIKWGTALSPQTEHLALLGEDLEHVWTRQVVEMGWLPPAGSDLYKLNVYLGSTGPDIPEIEFSGGYVWVDDDELPYITISADTLDSYEVPTPWFLPEELVAHEFNHTLQIRNSAFSANRYGPWLWEATASWVVPLTFEYEPPWGWGPFLLHPHVAVDMWAFDSGDPALDGRQYDTALFLYHLTEQRGLGADFIRDAWTDATPEDEVLAFFDARTKVGMEQIYFDFAVDYAMGDHDLAPLYEAGLEEAIGWGDPDDRIADVVPADGTGGLVRPPRSLRPEAWAWNQVRWNAMGEGTVTVAFEPETTGTSGTPSRFEAVAVRENGEGLTRFAIGDPIPVQLGDEVHLLVVSTAEDADVDERFGYQYDFAVEITPVDLPQPGGEPTIDNRCGCAADPSTQAIWLFPFALVALRRARRSD